MSKDVDNVSLERFKAKEMNHLTISAIIGKTKSGKTTTMLQLVNTQQYSYAVAFVGSKSAYASWSRILPLGYIHLVTNENVDEKLRVLNNILTIQDEIIDDIRFEFNTKEIEEQKHNSLYSRREYIPDIKDCLLMIFDDLGTVDGFLGSKIVNTFTTSCRHSGITPYFLLQYYTQLKKITRSQFSHIFLRQILGDDEIAAIKKQFMPQKGEFVTRNFGKIFSAVVANICNTLVINTQNAATGTKILEVFRTVDPAHFKLNRLGCQEYIDFSSRHVLTKHDRQRYDEMKKASNIDEQVFDMDATNRMDRLFNDTIDQPSSISLRNRNLPFSTIEPREKHRSLFTVDIQQ